MTGYLRPVDPTGGRICTYWTHCHRTIPSQEAGVDYYTPIGTPVRAAGPGVVYETGGGIEPATGRYITIDLDDGRRVRYLHLSDWVAKKGQRVVAGTIVGKSGASGYGSEFFGASSLAFIPADTGGPHVHTTLWAGHYYRFGQFPYEPTLDIELYVDKASTSGNGSTPFPTEVDVITDADRAAIAADVVKAVTALAVNRTVDGKVVQVPLLQELADAKTNAITAPDRVWATPVHRSSGDVPAIQELADAKTNTQAILDKIAALAASPAPTIDYAALAAAIIKAGGQAPSVDAIATAVRAKFTSSPLV